MLSHTLGAAVAFAIVALIQSPMALYEQRPRYKRRLAHQIIVSWCLAIVLYRAAADHWTGFDGFLFLGLMLLWFGLMKRGLLTDSVTVITAGAVVLCAWALLYSEFNRRDDIIAVLLSLLAVIGSRWCVQAYASYPPETRQL